MGITGIDWLNQIVAETLTTAPASDVQAIAGAATDKALTPSNIPALLAALAFPIVSSQPISLAEILTSSTPATARLVRSELTITPSVSAAVGSNGSLTAVRGAVTLSSGKGITAGYMYGVQGKFVGDGAIINVGSDHVAGLYGQLSLDTATLTSGHIAGVISDIQNVPTSSNVDLFYGESATGNVINSMFKGFGKTDYVFDLASNTHVQMGTTGGATTAAGWLKVLVEGVVRYINLYSTAP